MTDRHPALLNSRLHIDDVLCWAVWELADAVGAVFSNDEDVMFAVPAGPWFTFHHGDHRFHRNNHAWFQHGIDIFTQFQAGFATVVVRQHAKRVAVAEGTVGQ